MMKKMIATLFLSLILIGCSSGGGSSSGSGAGTATLTISQKAALQQLSDIKASTDPPSVPQRTFSLGTGLCNKYVVNDAGTRFVSASPIACNQTIDFSGIVGQGVLSTFPVTNRRIMTTESGKSIFIYSDTTVQNGIKAAVFYDLGMPLLSTISNSDDKGLFIYIDIDFSSNELFIHLNVWESGDGVISDLSSESSPSISNGGNVAYLTIGSEQNKCGSSSMDCSIKVGVFNSEDSKMDQYQGEFSTARNDEDGNTVIDLNNLEGQKIGYLKLKQTGMFEFSVVDLNGTPF